MFAINPCCTSYEPEYGPERGKVYNELLHFLVFCLSISIPLSLFFSFSVRLPAISVCIPYHSSNFIYIFLCFLFCCYCCFCVWVCVCVHILPIYLVLCSPFQFIMAGHTLVVFLLFFFCVCVCMSSTRVFVAFCLGFHQISNGCRCSFRSIWFSWKKMLNYFFFSIKYLYGHCHELTKLFVVFFLLL